MTMGKFPMGKVVLTKGVYDWTIVRSDFRQFVSGCLKRHARGDWGNLSPEDRRQNELALKDGSRLLSAYEHWRLPKIWIITEADRSATTVLFPDEY
jgi:hypothetical protein